MNKRYKTCALIAMQQENFRLLFLKEEAFIFETKSSKKKTKQINN